MPRRPSALLGRGVTLCVTTGKPEDWNRRRNSIPARQGTYPGICRSSTESICSLSRKASAYRK